MGMFLHQGGYITSDLKELLQQLPFLTPQNLECRD